MNQYASLTIWIVVYLAVGFGIGYLTQGSIDTWYAELDKPFFNPPNWIFPVMWSVLYVTIAMAGWRLWGVGAPKEVKGLFILYTFMNWAWTPIFFGLHEMMIGFFWIVAINVINAIFLMKAWRSNQWAARLMIPVFLWTLFAAVLNHQIWMLNG